MKFSTNDYFIFCATKDTTSKLIRGANVFQYNDAFICPNIKRILNKEDKIFWSEDSV